MGIEWSTGQLPPELRLGLDRVGEVISERLSSSRLEALRDCLSNQRLAHQLTRTIALSEYAAEVFRRYPDEVLDLLQSDELRVFSSFDDFSARINDQQSRCDNLNAALRVQRSLEMFRFIWRDLNRLCLMSDLTNELSDFADACIEAALAHEYEQLCAELGVPRFEDGQPMRMSVLGMGKLGAHELNLSSDIDLIFCYPHAGLIAESQQGLSYHEFFLRLSQRLIKTLDERTADGFVFRVDMRLRPYGSSGALALSHAAMEEYYQSQGRDWERYAMIKARCVAGDKVEGAQMLETLRPFVYRRYIDFSVIQSLRDMKRMIVSEVKRKGLDNDIKLGPGGIREIEFVAQAFQLVHGGRDKMLRDRELNTVLTRLAERELLEEQALTELQQAYEFLRNVEHALQSWRDEQTQKLPRDATMQLRLAVAMAYPDWESFDSALSAHRQRVREHFRDIVAPDKDAEDAAPDDNEVWQTEWQLLLNDEDLLEEAEGHRVPEALRDRDDAPELIAAVHIFAQSPAVQCLESIARDRLDQLMPLLLDQAAQHTSAVLAVERSLQVINAVLRRSSYLVLLIENPQALKHLVNLCADSVFLTRQISSKPLLLDELIDLRALYDEPSREELDNRLRQQMLRVEIDDVEAQMEEIRYFKLVHSLRIAAAELTGSLPLMKVSGLLSRIAETVLAYVLQVAWKDSTQKYGFLPGTDQEHARFLIVAYGKLGGEELSYGSDLDLVFLYEAERDAMSDGRVSLDATTYYTRLGQRIIHYLNTRTALGQAYEIDLRLRPSGNSGLLVSSLQAFESYQNDTAWTWEHQALVRARPVAGSTTLWNWFTQQRSRILCKPRDAKQLAIDVSGMRGKMAEHHASETTADLFHLKHDPGGIVDIEFMVQYAVLRYAHKYPSLSIHTDNFRILEALQAEGLLNDAAASELQSAYLSFRTCLHQRSLQDQAPQVAPEQFAADINRVRVAWQHFFA